MTRLEPLSVDELGEDERETVLRAEQQMGFLANDALVMARDPALLRAFGELVGAVYGPGKVDSGLKRLIGLITSTAAGCQYCRGHTAFGSTRHGIDEGKLNAALNFEASERFDDAEKAALRLALHAGQTPNGVTDEMFAELGSFYDENEQLEIVAVISMFGFLNRWNSTLGTALEAVPARALASIDEADGR